MQPQPDILVIEDDSSIRELIALWLRDAGYNVVESGGQLTHFVREMRSAKLIVVDLKEPKHGAIETIDALRERFPAAAIVAISGYFKSSPALAGALIQQLGVGCALAKPFSGKELLASVKALLGPP